MNRNDLVFVGVRLLGLYFLVQGGASLPALLDPDFGPPWSVRLPTILSVAAGAVMAIGTTRVVGWLAMARHPAERVEERREPISGDPTPRSRSTAPTSGPTAALRLKDSSYTMVPAILVLEQLGFTVTVQRHGDRRNWWRAERQSLELVATEPLKLLGLATIHDMRGTDWRASADEARTISVRHKLELEASSTQEPTTSDEQPDQPRPNQRT